MKDIDELVTSTVERLAKTTQDMFREEIENLTYN